MADSWRENAGFIGVQSYATSAGDREDLPVSILGSGSDYTVFFNRLGIASTDMLFDGPYGVYHSVYDTYEWMATQGDPGFLYHAAMARIAGLLALRFANADALPFDAAAYGREIARYADELAASPAGAPLAADSETPGGAGAGVERRRPEPHRNRSTRGFARGSPASSSMREVNAWLLSLERSLLDGAGLPGRPWFRHLIYAPLPSYRAETLPAIREAALGGGVESARLQVRRLVEKLDAAIAAAKAVQTAPNILAPRPSPRPRFWPGRRRTWPSWMPTDSTTRRTCRPSWLPPAAAKIL